MTDKTFIALDLEMNAKDREAHSAKIIQVGVAIGSYRNYLNQDYIEKSWFVDPDEDIEPVITELTGITNSDVKFNSSSYKQIHDDINKFISDNFCCVNPVVWGGGDLPLLTKEIKQDLGYCNVFGFREIDVKTIHTFYLISKNKNTKSSLQSAITQNKLKFKGTPHRAVDDARNTLNLFFHLLEKQSKIQDLLGQASSLV
jgi:DNA polymerase III epsilon subunit-like protein